MKPSFASLSLDLDNQWSYLKTHGDRGWESYPSFLDIVVPRVLRVLEERKLKITFFVVGKDAALEKNRAALTQIVRAGHEIGNHSFHHEPWLHLYAEEEIEAEIAHAEEAIERALGVVPRGFRGPGFSLSKSTLRVLQRRGYRYDCSTFPTYLGPLARAYYFMTAKLSEREKEERRMLFGTFAEGRRPLNPYHWLVDGETLLEIPVTTMPLFKTPIHVSYLLYASMASGICARAYFRSALDLCRWGGTEPSILLHPLDFLGKDDVRDLEFFPAMGVSGEEKTKRAGEFLDILRERFQILSMTEHASRLASRQDLPVLVPKFSHPSGSRIVRAPASSSDNERSIR
jgi:peptidoglycan/xylan/chitin deacetylase (PgdA/CDA1 family)